MNHVKVIFFASYRERAGTKEISLDLPEGTSVLDLKSILQERFPGLINALSAALVAVNRQYSFNEDQIPDGAEVAVFPPVSGGELADIAIIQPTIFKITEAPLNLDELLSKITLAGTGAICIFTGMVRNLTERDAPHETSYLEYEAYQPMAEEKMNQVAEEIRQKWPSIQGIAIVQRIGRLNPGTPTVIIACSAAHRDSGVFEAARYGIDRLKEIVPVWKREIGPQGEVWIEGKYTLKRGE